ncbi:MULTISPECIES: GNAT family N-acetyltransferase [Brucella/Ochrobactrum group]|uniref:GNAT family N-acetyltransferase n=2 Tax=Brucella/Ochrobactrum group TaxID=2826938 RepID=A0ABT3QS41_9HYPH|nr:MULTISPECIES: GNAT family N-acetyltransferase [Brucella/Ochrobactrum group]MCR5944306.1 GNAT family N-acetyltransferase [Ochrobactrum sp. XJ1]MCX2698425.1 GNAT family N-acetyltransferase [Ochrobactrum chromiisoli]MCX2698443.1 GNAT family N-acetyltransferase [Ochrobactrum chromiisoli]
MTGEPLESFKMLTERLELRLVKMSDSAALRKLMTPAISRWVAVWPFPLTQQAADRIIDKALVGHTEQRTLPLVIVNQADNQVIGWIKVDFEECDGKRTGEIGYWLSEEVHGMGLGYEAAQGLIAVCFEELKTHSMRAGAQTENTVSHNLLMKLGMHRTGEQLVFAPARDRDELCTFFEMERSKT